MTSGGILLLLTMALMSENARTNTESFSRPWERGAWLSPAFLACDLVSELDPSRSRYSPPPRSSVIKNCPLNTCLRYGTYTVNGRKEQMVMTDAAISSVSEFFEKGERIDGTRASCFKVFGGVQTSPKNKTDSHVSMTCDTHGSTCCDQGAYRVPGGGTVKDDSSGRGVCASCLPYFLCLGPEKTGTTDLYGRISLLQGVVAAAQKETGWWNGAIRGGIRAPTIAGAGIKFFRPLATALAPTLPDAVCRKNVSKDMCDLISGEATPYYLYFQHRGLSLVPRFIACIHPTVRLIVTVRAPVDRTYSDYNFFGRLQATIGGFVKRIKSNGTDEEKGIAYIRTLTPENFDSAMRAESAALEHCFVKKVRSMVNIDSDKHVRNGTALVEGRLLWEPPKEHQEACGEIRREQLEKLAFYSSRPPGRLLVSLYPLHLARWIHYIPCEQLMILRASKTWTESALASVADFLGLDRASAKHAAAGQAISPEKEIAFNKRAQTLARMAGMGIHAPPMLNTTRLLLEEFFAVHWSARFPDHHGQVEPCI